MAIPMNVLTFFLTFCQFLANFERLVLGCLDNYDSDQRLILQGFSRSTRFANLCTLESKWKKPWKTTPWTPHEKTPLQSVARAQSATRANRHSKLSDESELQWRGSRPTREWRILFTHHPARHKSRRGEILPDNKLVTARSQLHGRCR